VDDRLYETYAQIQDRHWWFRGRRAIIATAIEAWAPAVQNRSERRILDVGCGTGTNLGTLREYGKVTGVDSEAAAVDYCRRQGETDVQTAPATDLPFANSTFELATMLDVLEHVEDERAALAEARRVLVPGGHLLITVPAYNWMWGVQDEIARHKRRYTAHRLRAALQTAALEPVRSSYFNTILFAPIAMVRIGRRLAGSRPEHSDFEVTRPGRLDSLLGALLAAEATPATRLGLPFGVSLLALAQTPREGDEGAKRATQMLEAG
jgi:SAM-dependent methyltransferase